MVLLVAMATAISTAQQSAAVKTAELTPATTDISVGQKVKFAATAKDAAGNKTLAPATAWFAAPFDLAGLTSPARFPSLIPGGAGGCNGQRHSPCSRT